MVESNVVTVTYSPVAPPPTISLTLSVDKSSYDPNVDTLTFTVTASQDVTNKACVLIVDGVNTGLMQTFSGKTAILKVAPIAMPSQLKAQGSHSCKVASVGF